MRKLKLQIVITLDGYIAGPDGEMHWMIWDWDDQLKAYIEDITAPVDTILLGRKLAEGFIPHWTAAYHNPEGAEEGAQKMVETPKLVFTKTITDNKWDNTRLINGDVVTEINKLKQQPGSDIMVYGGANFVSSLIKHGLIDELHLLVNPTVLGTGMPIFRETDARQHFELVKAVPFECGIVVLNYRLKTV